MRRTVCTRFLGLLVVVIIAIGFGAQSFGTAASPDVADGHTAMSASMGIEWASVGILATGALIMFLWPRRRRQVEETGR